MLCLDFVYPTAAENLALDEALLLVAEELETPSEVLRFWEPERPYVVVGRSSRVALEVNHQECERRRIPILRRSSGGASIATAPGCLMYSLLLSHERRPAVRQINEAHRHVLETMVGALGALIPGIACRGTSDLVLGGRKVSGNSLQVKRSHVLYHGTFLYDFPVELAEACLAMPPRQPDYRAGRSHTEFIANLPVQPQQIKEALRRAWKAEELVVDCPRELAQLLVETKYRNGAWTYRH